MMHSRMRLPFFLLFIIVIVIGFEFWFGTYRLPTFTRNNDAERNDFTLEILNHSNIQNDKRLGILEKQVFKLRETVQKTSENVKTHKHTQLVDSLRNLSNKVTALERMKDTERNYKMDWMNGLTKTLVVMQLAESKIHHYKTFVKPSWDRLEMLDPETSHVLADLFIACHPNACSNIDEKCREIASNVTIDVFQKRQEHDGLLCFYAPVPEKQDEPYMFAHSLNFLQMEPFNSILNLNYYDYILRSDADAIFFPGLLAVRPTGDGWIGSGYSGTELTPHLVRRYTKRFLPDLGPPLRPNEMTPSMQSTFYVHKSKFRQFTSVLLNATKILHEKAFTKDVCDEITNLTIAQELHPGETNFCRWSFWHYGVSSLYGTRVAVDHVLENVTVSKSLDAMVSAMDRQDISTTIQAHLLELKHVIENTLERNLTDLCLHPIETMRKYEQEEGGGKKLFEYMETVYKDPEMADRDTAHYVADVLFRRFHKIACLEKEAAVSQ